MSVLSCKKRQKENPKEKAELIKTIIKNTYRILMTYGMKGCYIYCADQETGEYFKSRVGGLFSDAMRASLQRGLNNCY
ncbi:DNA/RNA helicase domain-containing protein [Sphingobacterium sp. xlx-130]|uniref:DNA/RNA helicase domain-containing protein n=1 Tax=Sphingobacterium sp. xlx-130 TaxID=2654323 RepID=UPI0013DA57D6|nr:DNA/RNA helicase domain-containing protein [Sphingobacterium sp. xlx-130]